MKAGSVLPAAVLASVLLLSIHSAVTHGSDLTPQERAGKRIYQRGHSDSGTPVYAWLGDPPIKVPASTLPCMNCHGFEGSGRPEGGLSPSNITWSTLTKSYGSKHASGRRHAPYTEETLRRAITEGIDPSGNRLGVGMPKFTMVDSDLDCLVAYLKRIEFERAPGVSETSVTIATVLPLEGRLASVGAAIRDTLKGRVEEINGAGGLYNRTFDLRVFSTDASGDDVDGRLRALLKEEKVFAIIAPYAADDARGIIAVAAEFEVPVIGPVGHAPEDQYGVNRFVFYLSSGLSTQVRVLAEQCVKRVSGEKRARVSILSKSGAPFTSLTRVVKGELADDVSVRVIEPYDGRRFDAERMAQTLRDMDAVIFLGPSADCVSVLRALPAEGSTPLVFLPGAFVGGDIFGSPARFGGRILAAFPNGPHAQSPVEAARYEDFLKRHDLDTREVGMCLGAYTSAGVFFEAVKRSGKDLRREQLIRQLEGFYKFRTGLIPPLTFGPDRRVGAYGAYVVSVDLEAKRFVGSSKWLEPSE